MGNSPGAGIMVGGQRAHFVVRSQLEPAFPNYKNNGFTQQVRFHNGFLEVAVEVLNQPLNSQMRGRRAGQLPAGTADLARLLDEHVEGDLVDQVAIIFNWMRNHINYADDVKDQAQDADTVLAMRSGNCVGFCNAAVSLLSSLDLQARAVTGVAFKSDDSVKLELKGQVLHRWIEVEYPDVGRVFCDPSGKIHFVEATYVVLAVHQVHDLDLAVRSAEGAEIELMSLHDGLRRVSHRSDLDGRLQMRPNQWVVPRRP